MNAEECGPGVTRYVLGFAFQGDKVILIQKEKPEWQKGKLNGVGGKVEDGETVADAMAREFREETGVETHPFAWAAFATLRFPNAHVRCFATVLPPGANPVDKTNEAVYRAETVGVVSRSPIYAPNLLYNIPPLVAMAKCCIEGVRADYLLTE